MYRSWQETYLQFGSAGSILMRVGEKKWPADFFFYEYLLDLCFGAVILRGFISLLYSAIAHLAAITSEITRLSVLRVNAEEQLTEGHLLLPQV